jgi:hypothetical protein
VEERRPPQRPYLLPSFWVLCTSPKPLSHSPPTLHARASTTRLSSIVSWGPEPQPLPRAGALNKQSKYSNMPRPTRDASVDSQDEPPPPVRRGRRPAPREDVVDEELEEELAPPPPPRRRGRPPPEPEPEPEEDEEEEEEEEEEEKPTVRVCLLTGAVSFCARVSAPPRVVADCDTRKQTQEEGSAFARWYNGLNPGGKMIFTCVARRRRACAVLVA